MTFTSYYKNILLTLLAMLVLWVPVSLRAQHLQASLSHYSVDDGLTSNAIAAIHSDDYGYLWLATWNGVSRFDGYNFYNYKTGITSGIRGLHNRIDNLIIDQAQNVWLKMYDGRMFVINRQTDRIEDPLEGIGGHDKYHVDYFFRPYVTSTGDILVSYADVGLYKLRLGRSGLKQDLIMTNNLNVSCVVEGYHDDIWVGTDKGIHRIDMPNLSLEKKGYITDESITYLTTNGYNIYVGTKSGKIMQFSYGKEPTLIKDLCRQITGLFVDSHGVLWFSDLGDGAYRLIPETGDVKFFNQNIPAPEFTSRGAEFNEALGTVWVRMNHGGFGYYNRETDEVEYFHNDPINPWNLSNTVNAHLEMNEGVVWESTIRRGLEKLELKKNTINRKYVIPGGSNLENEIRAMCYDKKRHLTFICNKKGSIFIYNDKGEQVGLLTQDSEGKPFGRAYGMSIDSKGNYWVCDKDRGLYKITPNSNGSYHIQNFHHDDNDKWSLSSNAAYQCVEDREGNIWVATYGGGVNVLRKNKDGRYIALNCLNAMKHYPANTHRKVRTIALAKDGRVWSGSTDGILIMSVKNNNVIIEEIKQPERLEDGLMSYDIVNLLCTPGGTMWVGTNSGGLSQALHKNEEGAWLFRNYGIEDGLPSEEIHSMCCDERGNIWLATDNVLCSFDITKKIFTTYSQIDGVDETITSEESAILGSNNNLLFGTLDGYYVIDRSKLTTSTGSLLKLRITDFFLDGQLQSPRLTDNYSFYVPESRSVTIPQSVNNFTFRFAAMNYQLQHRIIYQYKIDGYDREWKNADKSRTATYSGLPAGTYRFQVKAFLLESPDAFDQRTIEIVIPASFILSPIAVLIYMILLMGGALYGLYWYQERLKKRTLEARLVNNYNDFTADNDADGESADDGNTAGGTVSSQSDPIESEEATDEYEIMN